ncbi:hypothetical protein CCACVL1_01388, partial [Corchorus capsularis]
GSITSAPLCSLPQSSKALTSMAGESRLPKTDRH